MTREQEADVAVIDDGEVISLLLTMCETETSAGLLAQARGDDKDVIATGDKLIAEHEDMKQVIEALAAKNGIEAKDNALSRLISRKGSDDDARCAALTGKAFDRAFLESEIRVHEFARYLVSGVFLRDVQNADLKELLVKAVPSVDENLEAVTAMRRAIG